MYPTWNQENVRNNECKVALVVQIAVGCTKVFGRDHFLLRARYYTNPVITFLYICHCCFLYLSLVAFFIFGTLLHRPSNHFSNHNWHHRHHDDGDDDCGHVNGGNKEAIHSSQQGNALLCQGSYHLTNFLLSGRTHTPHPSTTAIYIHA